VNHVFTRPGFYNSKSYEVPENSGNMLSKTIYYWYSNITNDDFNADDIGLYRLIDTADWPNNRPCANTHLKN